MHPKCCVRENPRDTYNNLRNDLATVKDHMYNVATWELSEDVLNSVLAELESQRNEIKERMHDFIDTL